MCNMQREPRVVAFATFYGFVCFFFYVFMLFFRFNLEHIMGRGSYSMHS